MKKALLFEILCEDLPARQIEMALSALRDGFVERCKDARIVHGAVKAYATPRRLALQVADVADKQEDLSSLRVGPALSAARDAQGNLTPAALGFLNGLGAQESQIEEVIQEKKKGKPASYIAVRVNEEGALSATLLTGILEEALAAIHWAKPMRWGALSTEFARPVHRIVAILGSEVIPVHFAGINAGNLTVGHRFMAPGDIVLDADCDYVACMREAYVLVDIQERRARVMQEAERVCASVGGNLVYNEDLLDEVVEILEWPVGVVGGFDKEFLRLPREVLETSMCKNQRYFSVVDDAGNLMPYFVTLSNTEVADCSVVARGNERVLRARLKDAEFFFAEDQRCNLEAYNEALRRVRYVEGMGTVYERSQRIGHVARRVCSLWSGAQLHEQSVDRAAQLCKADLVTGMVGEFPELQGVMGSIYAGLSGESEEVSLAIREHYAPRQASDRAAQSTTGAIVAVAEKLDSIVSLFSLGRIPTGTADPFALRRAAVGLLRTLLEHRQTLALAPLVEAGIEAVLNARAQSPQESAPLAPSQDTLSAVVEFITTRLRFMLTENHAPEVVDCVVLNSALADIPGIVGRIEALSAQRETADFASLIAIFKRVANILRQAQGLEEGRRVVDVALFECEQERAFYLCAEQIGAQYDAAMKSSAFEEALGLLSQLREPADQFFETVLVNSENEAVRKNRYALLSQVAAMFTQFADVRRL